MLNKRKILKASSLLAFDRSASLQTKRFNEDISPEKRFSFFSLNATENVVNFRPYMALHDIAYPFFSIFLPSHSSAMFTIVIAAEQRFVLCEYRSTEPSFDPFPLPPPPPAREKILSTHSSSLAIKNICFTCCFDERMFSSQFKCCGALRFEDWVVSEWHKDENVLENGSLVPDSCCKTPTLLCGRRDHPSNIHYTVHTDSTFIFLRFVAF